MLQFSFSQLWFKFIRIYTIFSFLLCAPINATTVENLLITGSMEHPYSWILFLEDPTSGEQWVLKQIKDTAPEEQLQLLLEVLGGEMAEELDISMNRVCFLGSHIANDLKPMHDLPATLHSKAPGKLVEDLVEWQDLEIGQRIRPPNTLQYKKYGPLPSSQTGLTWRVIEQMARHRDLPPIVALDTFIGNRDRWENNLFYDQKTDTFTGIDLGESYKFNLCAEARKRIEMYCSCENELYVSSTVIKAIKSYRSIIEELATLWPKHRISKRMIELYRQGGFSEDENGATRKLERYLEMIKKSYNEIDPFLEALTLLITKLETIQIHRSYTKGKTFVCSKI